MLRLSLLPFSFSPFCVFQFVFYALRAVVVPQITSAGSQLVALFFSLSSFLSRPLFLPFCVFSMSFSPLPSPCFLWAPHVSVLPITRVRNSLSEKINVFFSPAFSLNFSLPLSFFRYFLHLYLIFSLNKSFLNPCNPACDVAISQLNNESAYAKVSPKHTTMYKRWLFIMS